MERDPAQLPGAGTVTATEMDVGLFTGAPAQPFGLAWLTAPVATHDFLDTFWERRAAPICRAAPDYYSALPAFDEIDELIAGTASNANRPADDMRIVRAEADGALTEHTPKLDFTGFPDVQDIYRAYHAGFTLVINRVQRRSAAVAQLAASLEADLHHPVGVNLYVTPRSGQGFLPHTDDHDVFVLQLYGAKVWHVGNPARQLPLPKRQSGEGDRAPLLDFETFTLERGDALYIPRGFPHEAVTTDTSSAHLTVGIHTFKWIDLVTEIVTAVAEDDVELRKSLGLGFLDAPLTAAGFAPDLIAALHDPALVERARRRLQTRLLNSSKVLGAGHFRALDAVGELRPESVVQRVAGRICRMRTSAEEARLEFGRNFVAGPPHLRAALEYVAEHQRFVIADLPGELNSTDKVDLVTRMVTEGLLSPTDGDGRKEIDDVQA